MKKIMPVLFIGHGSPMNAIETNEFTASWQNISNTIPRPKAIIVISAHYEKDCTAVTANKNLETIYDFYGFPKELYSVRYDCKTSADALRKIKALIDVIKLDNSWGIDHGAWSVLSKMYPKADIPVVELSINNSLTMEGHYMLGKKLAPLRKHGFLILCSGNIVHNLMEADTDKPPYGWAKNFDDAVKKNILNRADDKLINYRQFGDDAMLSVNSAEHYIPLLYALGATDKAENASFFCEKIVYSSISMRSVLFGHN